MAAALQAQRLFLTASTSSSPSSSCTARRPRRSTAAPCRAALRMPSGLQASPAATAPADLALKLDWIDARAGAPTAAAARDGTAGERLRAVADAAADRAEMHDIIGRQRDNWNHLLLHSTNSLALAASAMAALAPVAPPIVAALKASAGALLATAAVTMAAFNRIQPSQLAEEQRNATRLWRQLERDVSYRAAAGAVVTDADVQEAMDRVLALDAAYPLPLLPGMLEKFPKTVEPARWWPRRRPQPQPLRSRRSKSFGRRAGSSSNGWTSELEEEMRGLLRVLRAKDEHQYLTVGRLVLTLNRGLAVAGPALAGAGAVAAAFIGGGDAGGWASGAAVLCGALAAAANTVEHGGQLGMLFELLRNCAGFYRKVQEDIEAALGEADPERRENGEVFETKVALLLGRSATDLRQFREMASPSFRDEDIKDYAGKLF
ncbi:putative F-box protein [Panicum miliaceum]|uniref:F-box protein n=1 Tax=Panicum miliaceum TaxID=4540 RepID=A0A3L6QIK9_PANMI|nr:putative F-box protein [Panicum miliaceum]